MRRITIVTKDYTGLIADITEVLGKENINIESIDAEKIDTTALIKITSDDADKAYQILVDAGFHVVSQAGLLIKLKDKAGALAQVSRKLAENCVDIRGVNMVEQHDGYRIVALSCSDSDKAGEILSDVII
ncbi:ACT domain-containing protein [Aliikangiella sp. G2MR2-5]|uniref:ACT domain-containing protein n=1 Tax=Aliikangiella sp. G2MR2-5 TaxID=2788943 RepID=UPI0018AAC12C|nr:hypothetical protein [Aliikangiella sp. G2MR2-5]